MRRGLVVLAAAAVFAGVPAVVAISPVSANSARSGFSAKVPGGKQQIKVVADSDAPIACNIKYSSNYQMGQAIKITANCTVSSRARKGQDITLKAEAIYTSGGTSQVVGSCADKVASNKSTGKAELTCDLGVS
jgi:hypothetical protein